MMDRSYALDQPSALSPPSRGVQLIDMDRLSGPLASVRALVRRTQMRLMQWLIDVVVRKALRLWMRDREAALTYIDRWRAYHMRPDTVSESVIEVNAVRAAPRGMLTPPPAECQWFAPHKGEPHGFVFYVHGGSFIADASPKITAMVAKFAAQSNARVFAPSYRLAPEHPCPAAVDDIVSAFRWFRREWPNEPVVALAESAGAAILLAALQRLRDDGEALPQGVVLLSPWVDVSLQSWSVIAASLAGTTPYSMESMAMTAHLYLQGFPATDPVASPLYGSFAEFPPMLIHASKCDMVYDDAVRLADKVRDSGGDLTVRLWTAESHAWEQTSSPRARQSIDLAAEFIQRCLD